MNLSIDWDDTYTRDPSAWNDMIRLFRARGHKVYIVTWRFESEANDIYLRMGDFVDGIYCTGRKGKRAYMYKQGIRIDVFIDDTPDACVRSMAGFETEEELTGLVIPV